MKAEGYLPHWKETHVASNGTGLMLKVNGSVRWNGTIEDFKKIHQEKIVSFLRQKPTTRYRWSRIIRTQLSFLMALVIAFFPKCPFCWAAYMSLFSSFGLGKLPYQPWMLPVLIGLLFLNIISLYLSRKRHGFKPLIIGIIGAALVTMNRLYWMEDNIMIIGAILLVTASLWNSLPRRMVISLKYFLFPAKSTTF